MARDADALLMRKWATEVAAIRETPALAGLTREEGYPDSYGEDQFRSLALWNQQVREVTAAFVEIAQRGILEWNPDQRYEHPAWVTGSDGSLYFSVKSSGGEVPSENPVTDITERRWVRFILSTPTSTTVQRGTIETATAPEARAGLDNERAVTPASARSAIASALTSAKRPVWL